VEMWKRERLQVGGEKKGKKLTVIKGRATFYFGLGVTNVYKGRCGKG